MQRFMTVTVTRVYEITSNSDFGFEMARLQLYEKAKHNSGHALPDHMSDGGLGEDSDSYRAYAYQDAGVLTRMEG